MKLLKVLATGAVALAVSTSVMAQVQPSGNLLKAFACTAGYMETENHVCLGAGLVMNIAPVVTTQAMASTPVETIQEGIFSDVLSSLGPIKYAASGSVSNRYLIAQAVAGAQTPGDYTELPANMAAVQCMIQENATGPASSSYVPTIYELRQLLANMPKLVAGFDAQQNDFTSPGAHLTSAQKAIVRAALVQYANGSDALEFGSSSEDPSTPGNYLTLNRSGVVASVAKNTVKNHICVQKFNPAMMVVKGLLQR